jgi:hypothetical protein
MFSLAIFQAIEVPGATVNNNRAPVNRVMAAKMRSAILASAAFAKCLELACRLKSAQKIQRMR